MRGSKEVSAYRCPGWAQPVQRCRKAQSCNTGRFVMDALHRKSATSTCSAAVMHNSMYAQQLLPAGCWRAGMPTSIHCQPLITLWLHWRWFQAQRRSRRASEGPLSNGCFPYTCVLCRRVQ